MTEITYTGGTRRGDRFEELFELHEVIEPGPNWNTIERIVVTLNMPSAYASYHLRSCPQLGVKATTRIARLESDLDTRVKFGAISV
jgi:hypothetical protein